MKSNEIYKIVTHLKMFVFLLMALPVGYPRSLHISEGSRILFFDICQDSLEQRSVRRKARTDIP